MATSVRPPEAVLVTAEVKINGTKIPSTALVQSVDVTHAVNRIPRATVTIADGSAAEENFPASEQERFAPGGEIEILAGYEASNRTIFKGVITGEGIRIGPDGNSCLVLTCRDRAVAATVARQSVEYREMTDSDAIRAALSPFGLDVSVASTGSTHEHLILNAATPWDFALTRAEANGMVALVADGKVTIAHPAFDSARLVAGFGDSIIDLDLDVDATTQVASVAAKSWDPKTQSVTTEAAAEPSVNRQGNLSGPVLSRVLDVKDVTLASQSWLQPAMLKGWASGALMRARLSRIRGRVTVTGNAGLAAGTLLDLSGLGKRFNGGAYVSAVRHQIDQGNWHSVVTVGLPDAAFSDTHRDVTEPPASSLAPGVTGLQIATVKQVYDDPEEERRVLVVLPMSGGESSAGLWARIASPYATKNAGIEFLPEVGDEVVVGYLGDDPSSPIVLGSLHSSPRPSPVTPDEQNKIKAIVTNSQLKISFDDVDKVLTLETPGGHSVTMSDEAKSIQVKDSNGNALSMSEEGIEMSSPKDVTISADGSVSIKGTSGVTVSSPADVSVSGSNVSVTAEMELSTEGAASASLTSSGEVTIQGMMVMIN